MISPTECLRQIKALELKNIDERIADAAHKMLDDAKAAGKSIYIGSVYRSLDDQARIFNYSMKDRINSGLSYWQAYQSVALVVAEPGTSEHALGIALDLTSNVYVELDEGQEKTPEYKWFKENCYKYGFILRYPPETAHITGIEYEPWHYRYVGKEAAMEITERGICLEEYIAEKWHHEEFLLYNSIDNVIPFFLNNFYCDFFFTSNVYTSSCFYYNFMWKLFVWNMVIVFIFIYWYIFRFFICYIRCCFTINCNYFCNFFCFRYVYEQCLGSICI